MSKGKFSNAGNGPAVTFGEGGEGAQGSGVSCSYCVAALPGGGCRRTMNAGSGSAHTGKVHACPREI